MALTDTAIRNAKAKEKPYKLTDALGLYLQIQRTGAKLWHFKYRVDGKEQKLSLGMYPDVSLSEARKRRDEARQMRAAGKNPAMEKKRVKLRSQLQSEDTFSALSAEYCDKRKRDGHRPWAPATTERSEYLLSLLSGTLGAMPIAEIEPADVLAAIRKIEARGTRESARRTLQLAGAVFRYGVATTRLSSDPTRDLRGALTTPRVRNYSAITEPSRVGELLRAIEDYQGHGYTGCALRLAPHLFVRPGELRHAEWSEIDLEGAVWTIPAGKMKMRKPHSVPLSRQVIELFREISPATGPSGYVFPGLRVSSRPMSENTMNAALRRLGFSKDEMTTHGFRTMASSLLNESGKWNPDAIERALAHGDTDRVRGAYHRAAYWSERVEMAQWWSDYLDSLRKGAEIVPIHTRARAA